MNRQEIEQAVAGLEFTKKAIDFKEVNTSVATPGLILILKKLPTFKEQEILPGGLATDFSKEMPQYFLMKGKDKSTYLIDTQGYEYPRYITRLAREL